MKIVKKKKQKIKKKFTWNVWLTIISVFLGVAVLGGAVVLGVYLTGGFEEKTIAPDKISFGYDEDTYLEIDKDLQLTVQTEKKFVTENKVTLSFDSNVPVVKRREGEGYIISNKIIEVPEIVYIGKPFTVHLLKERLIDDDGNEILSNGQPVDWIVGGLSTLYAKSEAPSTQNTKIKLAIDVPVYDTEVVVINSNGVETDQIVTNESFSVKTKFIPAKSEFMYSDFLRIDLEESQIRVKRSYYEAVNTNKITAVYDDIHNMHFVAGNEMVGEDIGVEINSYTFKSAKAQLEQEALIADVTNPEDYHQAMLGALVNSSDKVLKDEVVSIGEASIGNFTIAKNKVSMNAETPLRLYMNKYNYQSASDFLGVNVYSTSGQILDKLLSSIAIAFTLNDKDVAYGQTNL